MSANGIVLVVVTAVLTMAANLMLRVGIDAGGGFSPPGAFQALYTLAGLFLQPVFLLGFVAYVMATVVWFRVIATEPLSLAYPIGIGLTFALVTAGAAFLFHEPLSIRKAVGLAIIVLGIIITSEKNPR
jgi:multidrug transporter EmrE-like cation transporter